MEHSQPESGGGHGEVTTDGQRRLVHSTLRQFLSPYCRIRRPRWWIWWRRWSASTAVAAAVGRRSIGRLDLVARVPPLDGFSVKAVGDLPLAIFLPFFGMSGSRAREVQVQVSSTSWSWGQCRWRQFGAGDARARTIAAREA